MPMPMVVLNKYLISRVYKGYINAVYKRGIGYINALLREKWSKKPELPPEFEPEKPLYFWPVTLASMHGEAQMYLNK